MTIEQARARAGAALGGAVACVPMHELADAQWPEALPPVLVTAELPMREAVAVYRSVKQQRGRSGLSPLIVTRDGFDKLRLREWLSPDPSPAQQLAAELAAYELLTSDEFFARRLARAGEDPAPSIEAALDSLGSLTGQDPMAILHRIRLDDLEALGGGEGDFDPDDLLPDDVEAAHARMLVEREALLEMARRGPNRYLVMPPRLRPFDEETTLAELADGPARLLLSASSPATALLYVGFGGFNDCPAPHAHARVWQQWGAAFGAEPVLLEADTLHAVVARPPTTRAALVRFAREGALYDRDALTAGPLPLAGCLYRCAAIDFWWD
jgi:hypothetical protein